MAAKRIHQAITCAHELVSVTPSDSADLDAPCPAIHVSVGGAIKITTLNGSDVTIPAVAGGGVWPVGAQRIWSTGTTATGIFAVYNQ